MKILGSTESTTRLEEGVVGVGAESRAGRSRNKLDRSKFDDGEVDGGKIDGEIGKKDKKTHKSKKTLRSDFFTPEARLAFTELRQAFVKALILHHFNLEYHI